MFNFSLSPIKFTFKKEKEKALTNSYEEFEYVQHYLFYVIQYLESSSACELTKKYRRSSTSFESAISWPSSQEQHHTRGYSHHRNATPPNKCRQIAFSSNAHQCLAHKAYARRGVGDVNHRSQAAINEGSDGDVCD